MVAAAGQRAAAPRCNPGSTPGISSPASVTAPAPSLAGGGVPAERARRRKQSSRPAHDRNNPARRTLKIDTSTHLGRQRPPAASNLRTNR